MGDLNGRFDETKFNNVTVYGPKPYTFGGLDERNKQRTQYRHYVVFNGIKNYHNLSRVTFFPLAKSIFRHWYVRVLLNFPNKFPTTLYTTSAYDTTADNSLYKNANEVKLMMDDFQFRLIYRLRNSQNVLHAQHQCIYLNCIIPFSVRVYVHVKESEKSRNRLCVFDITPRCIQKQRPSREFERYNVFTMF